MKKLLEKLKKISLALYFAPLFIFYGFIFAYPIFLTFVRSFGLFPVTPKTPSEFTLKYYFEFFQPNSVYIPSLWFSFWNSVVTTFIAAIFGYLVALYFFKANYPGKKTVSALFKSPLFVPYLVGAFMWMEILAAHGYVNGFLKSLGLINQPLRLIWDPYGIGIIIANVWMNVAFMSTLMLGALESLNPDLTYAARNLGAGTWTIVRKIYFPLTLPAFLAGSILIFVGIFGAFSVPFVLGGSWPKYLSVVIYEDVVEHRKWVQGYVSAVIYIISAVILTYVYTILMRRMAGRK